MSCGHIAHQLLRLFETYNIHDRWNFRRLRPWLLQAGFHERQIAEQWVEQGSKSMAPVLRELEVAILERELAQPEGGDSSVRRLSKKPSTGRIDGMVALTMALGVAPLRPPKIDIAALIG